MKLKSALFTGVAVLAFNSAAFASTITFDTPAGSTQAGLGVKAEAVFTTSAGSISVTLTNLTVNPSSVAQNLSDLSFVLGGIDTSAAAFASGQPSASLVTVANNGSTTFSTGSTGWNLVASSSNLLLCDLCAAIGPAHTIIGPADASGNYSNGGGSITGNGPHNPFINQTVTFVINDPTILATTTVTSATFSFGTTEGNNVPGVTCTTGCTEELLPAPEPGSLVLLGTGLVGAAAFLRRRLAL